MPVVKGPASLAAAPYLGCYEDDGARVLPERAFSAADMTAAKCADHCAGFKYFGTEYGAECYCGNSLPPNKAATEDDCKKPCEGNALEFCGGGMRLSVYGFTDTPAPVTNDDIGSFVYQGCHGTSLPTLPVHNAGLYTNPSVQLTSPSASWPPRPSSPTP